MPASPIRRLVPYAEEAKRKGRKVYHLNIGQPDIHSPQEALRAVKEFAPKVIEYSHSAGNESYRKQLCDYYRGIGIQVDPGEILITTGGSEAISFALMGTLDPGGELIVPEPFYANYYGFSVAAGVKVVPVTSRIEDGFALPAMEEFEKLITENTRGILICSPNNPTGTLYSKREMESLGDIVRKHDLYLYSDEVYREFCYGNEQHFSAMYLKGLEDHVILLDSISKRYSMCGARIGALVSKNPEVIGTALKFAQARLSPPTFGQVAGEAALNVPEAYFRDVRDEYMARRDFLVAALNSMPGVTCPIPGGAFYTVARLPVDDADRFAQWILSDFEYQDQTVMMAPASGFYSTPGLGKQEVRIAYVLNLGDLARAMEALSEALRVYPGRTD